jgi:hypothetical protein
VRDLAGVQHMGGQPFEPASIDRMHLLVDDRDEV